MRLSLPCTNFHPVDPYARIGSASSGSTLMTLAPSSANSSVAIGVAIHVANSRTVMPWSNAGVPVTTSDGAVGPADEGVDGPGALQPVTTGGTRGAATRAGAAGHVTSGPSHRRSPTSG